MIVHGLNDENVHFAHTAQLVAALIKAKKPVRVQVSAAICSHHEMWGADAIRHIMLGVPWRATRSRCWFCRAFRGHFHQISAQASLDL
jgi:hypothetical protein